MLPTHQVGRDDTAGRVMLIGITRPAGIYGWCWSSRFSVILGYVTLKRELQLGRT